jgi:ribosomal protein L7/L12
MEEEARLSVRVGRIEKTLEAIAKHIGLDLDAIATDDTPSPEVLRYIRDGQLIQAIAAYRNETGVGLREAKEAVEEIQRRMKSR